MLRKVGEVGGDYCPALHPLADADSCYGHTIRGDDSRLLALIPRLVPREVRREGRPEPCDWGLLSPPLRLRLVGGHCCSGGR